MGALSSEGDGIESEAATGGHDEQGAHASHAGVEGAMLAYQAKYL